MHIEATIDEAVQVVRAVRPLPAMVLDVRAAQSGDAVEVDIDPKELPGASGLIRFGAALAGNVTVTARFVGFAAGDATFALAAQARGITVDKILNQLSGRISANLAAQGLPPDVIELRPAGDGLELVAHAQAAADARATGVVVQSFDLSDKTIRVDLDVPEGTTFDLPAPIRVS